MHIKFAYPTQTLLAKISDGYGVVLMANQPVSILKLSLLSSLTMLLFSTLTVFLLTLINKYFISIETWFWGIIFIVLNFTYGLYYSIFFRMLYKKNIFQ